MKSPTEGIKFLIKKPIRTKAKTSMIEYSTVSTAKPFIQILSKITFLLFYYQLHKIKPRARSTTLTKLSSTSSFQSSPSC
jgi:hypothetical protein